MYKFWWFCSDGNFISTIPYPKLFGYLIPTLAAIVGASVQGRTKPLTETHRVSLCVCLAAIIVHYIAFTADKKSQCNQANSSQFWGLIAVISGSLSAVALISTFFTHSAAEIICYIAFGCAALIILVYQNGSMLMDACRWMYHEILRPFFFNTLDWLQANIHLFNREQQHQSAVQV